MEKQPNSRVCFVRGIENPIGLKLKVHTDDEGPSSTHFRPDDGHQGYSGQLQGGISSPSLDVPTQISGRPGVLAV